MKYDDSKDEKLITLCISGREEEAWEIFVRRYSKLIWNSIRKTFWKYSFPYSNEDIEDVYSGIFLSLVEEDYRRLKQFSGKNGSSLPTWLVVVSERASVSYMRKEKSGLFIEPADDADIFASIPGDGPDCLEVLAKSEDEGRFMRALGSLSDEERSLYTDIYVKGIPFGEAAQVMGLSEAALYTRKHRLIKKIRRLVLSK